MARLEFDLQATNDPDEKRELARERTKVKRRRTRWRRRQRLANLEERATVCQKRSPPSLWQAEEEVWDRERWPEILGNWATEKYDDPDLTLEDQAAYLESLEAKARFHWLHCTLTPEDDTFTHPWVNAEVVKQQMDLMRLDKQTGGDDLPAELLSLLRPEDHQKLAHAFDKRIKGVPGSCAAISQWLTQNLHGFPKSGDTRQLRRWRFLGVTPMLYKLYEMVLWHHLWQHLYDLPRPILAFRKGKQTMEASECLRVLCSKAKEWGHDLVVASMDITAAFDFMRPCLMHELLLEEGASPQGALAWLREHVGMRGHINVAGICAEAPIEIKRGCRQGGARTPAAWNVAMACLLRRA